MIQCHSGPQKDEDTTRGATIMNQLWIVFLLISLAQGQNVQEFEQDFASSLSATEQKRLGEYRSPERPQTCVGEYCDLSCRPPLDWITYLKNDWKMKAHFDFVR
jgi:hypothetical protein